MNRHIHKDKHMSKSTLVDQDETVMPDLLLKFSSRPTNASDLALILNFQVLVDINDISCKSPFPSCYIAHSHDDLLYFITTVNVANALTTTAFDRA